MRSLFAGVSALRNHQVRMDVIGNNIANVNTIGYKAQTVTFKEQLAQTLRGAGAPQSGRGGTNPQQVGLGVDLGAITTIHTPGSLQSTGVESDLAIEGNGFFVLSDGSNTLYTRSGVFDFDREGNLVSLMSGLKVMGYAARNGEIDYARGLVPIEVPLSTTLKPTPTSEASVVGNLDARQRLRLTLEESSITLTDPNGDAEAVVTLRLQPAGTFGEWTWDAEVQHSDGTVETLNGGTLRVDVHGNVIESTGGLQVDVGDAQFSLAPPGLGDAPSFVWDNGTVMDVTATEAEQTTLRIFDSLGAEHDIFFAFEKGSQNEWIWQATDIAGNVVGTGRLVYDSAGGLVTQTGTIELDPAGAESIVLTPDFSQLTQYADATDVSKTLQNGFPAGTLSSLSIDTAGRIHGLFSNGLSEVLAQVALADFANPAGLLKAEDGTFRISPNSGQPDIGVPGTGSRGSIRPGALEMSNVDLSNEFTEMIVTQRGFQANSRIITTADEMLQELVNLKR